MKETFKKLDNGIVEIQREVTNIETVTVNQKVLDENIRSAEIVVKQRQSELESAQKNLQELQDLKMKINNVK